MTPKPNTTPRPSKLAQWHAEQVRRIIQAAEHESLMGQLKRLARGSY